MEYFGSADYYFWIGVENGFKWPTMDLPKKPQDMFYFNSPAAIEAFNAFNWGYCLGLVLSENEYNELTNPVRNDTIVDNRKDSGIYVDMEGNC